MMTNILLLILVILEAIRLILTFQTNKRIFKNADEITVMRDRWNEMCSGITGFMEHGEYVNDCVKILIDTYGWTASEVGTLDVDQIIQMKQDGKTPAEAAEFFIKM